MAPKTVLVAGASGIAGGAIARHFAALEDWTVVAVSRRRPQGLPAEIRHFALDLTDREACLAVLNKIPEVGYVAYAALQEQDDLLQGWKEQTQMDTNLDMLRNLLDGVAGSGIRHVVALQGGKAYGSHLHPVPVPAKERWPRGDHEIFYWAQEDLLRERQRSEGWGLTILRPSMILGASTGSPMSIVAAIGAYAAIMREVDGSLSFPGGGRYVTSCTDSRLIAEAVEFSFQRGGPPEIFNVVNGDVIVWEDLWASIAEHFGIRVSDPRPMNLMESMPGYSSVWDVIVARDGLRELPLAELIGSAWQFADYAFAAGIPDPPEMVVMSPIKLRQAGFPNCYDTEDSFAYWLGQMQAERLLPR